MKRERIFIIDKYFNVIFFYKKDCLISHRVGRISRESQLIELPYSFKRRSEIQKKIILYHLYFILSLEIKDTIGADSLMFEQLSLEGHKAKEVFLNFIKIIDISDLSVQRAKSIKNSYLS